MGGKDKIYIASEWLRVALWPHRKDWRESIDHRRRWQNTAMALMPHIEAHGRQRSESHAETHTPILQSVTGELEDVKKRLSRFVREPCTATDRA